MFLTYFYSQGRDCPLSLVNIFAKANTSQEAPSSTSGGSSPYLRKRYFSYRLFIYLTFFLWMWLIRESHILYYTSVAEQADARDLKSPAPSWAYRFNSCRAYQYVSLPQWERIHKLKGCRFESCRRSNVLRSLAGKSVHGLKKLQVRFLQETALYVYVAQSAERLAVNQIVAGSIPAVNANMLR